MLKISTCFKNRIPSANLIFRNDENKGVNLIYFPEYPNRGTNFINLYRKKNYWDYVIIPMAFLFLSHKVYGNNYHKDFKKTIPTVRIQRKFIKNNQELRSIVVDLTALSESFSALTKSRSRKQIMETMIKLIEQFATDSKEFSDKETYWVIDGNGVDDHEIVDALFYYSRLEGNKLRLKNIKGIVVYGNKRFWPLTINEEDKDGPYLKINITIISRYLKEVHGVEEVKKEDPTESILKTKQTVEALYKVHNLKKASATGDNALLELQKDQDIEENPLDLIRNEVLQNKNIQGKSFEEKLTNLFKPKAKAKAKAKAKTKAKVTLDKEIPKVVKDINRDILELNKKYNGTIELNESVVNASNKKPYDPFKVIGFNDFNGYNKQKTEFGGTMDQAMYDLMHSIERDKDLNIKVLNIKTDITDTYKDRFKTYKTKIQHKDFGYRKPYTVSFHIPIPSKGKYLKINGSDWIMINQFYAKPVVKVAPNMVRVYTQFSTCSVRIKHHALNDSNGVGEMMETMNSMLKHTKKLKSTPKKLSDAEVDSLIAKYNLPETLESDVFLNLEIKTKNK